LRSLKDVLTAPTVRRDVIRDTIKLVDEEVAAKRGVTGLALKAGYGVFKKIKPGVMQEAVDNLLDDFASALDPYYQQHIESSETGSISRTIMSQRKKVAESLLDITDSRAKKHKDGVVKKTYYKLRPTAIKHTEEAIPGVCRLVDKYI
jgi:hypothetical protein